MNRAPHIPAREQLKGIACVHRERRILRFDPFPFFRDGVLDLEARDGLTEEEGEGAEVWGTEGE